MTRIRAPRRHHPLALAIALALAAGSANAATITVASNLDDNGSSCTLREAIVTMKHGSTSGSLEGACRTTYTDTSTNGFGTNDTIVFGTQVPSGSTVSLTLGQLTVSVLTAPLSIQGSGQTIVAHNNYRVLFVNSATLTASSLTLSGGIRTSQYGGAVYAKHSTLTLANSTISGSSAYAGGGLAGYQSKVTLTDCTVSGNNAQHRGGGLSAIFGKLNLSYSTVSGNTADTNGGGLWLDNAGANVTNSTIYGNSAATAGGGVYGNSATLTNNTIATNTAGSRGGGVYAIGSGAIFLNNTILANNIGGDCDLGSSPAGFAYGQYSLIKDTSNACGIVNGNLSNVGNLIGSDPKLAVLRNNGGPTETMVDQAPSPAFNHGSVALAKQPGTSYVLSFDQRGTGFPRLIRSTVDIGAWQHQPNDRIFANPFESDP